MNHRERIEAVLNGEKPDRVPVALWRHFPVDDMSADTLAEAVKLFQATYDFDLVKVTYASSYMVTDWGVSDVWEGASEGTRTYKKRIIHKPDDWYTLPQLDVENGSLGRQLVCMRQLREHFGPDVPLLATIFSPFAQARKLVGDENVFTHMRKYPEAFKVGLETIANSTAQFVEALVDTGIDGIFFAIQHGQYGKFTEEEHATFGRQFDNPALDAASALWVNMLHLHGTDVMFHLAADYPVDIINWHDRETFPSLTEAQDLFDGVLCGGLRRLDTMELGMPADVIAEAQDAIDATGGTNFILGTGCVLPITTPHGNIAAARKAVEVK